METRANYLRVGSFVLTFLVGLILFVIWLAKFQFDTEFQRYDIFFQGSVTGLKEGSPVRYSGVKVGEVVFIGLDRENPSQVRALIEVEASTPIREDTIASLALAGLTGGRYILLSGGSLDSGALEVKEGQTRPTIESKASSIEQVMEGAPEVLTSANALLVQANEIFGPENRARISTILENFSIVSTSLASKSDRIETVIEDTANTVANLRGTSEALKEMAVSLQEDSTRLVDSADAALTAVAAMAGSIDGSVNKAEEDVRGLVVDLRGSAKAFTAMAGEFQAMAEESRKPLRDFTENGLYELTTLLSEARGLLVSLNRVTTEVERDPARFLFGDQQQGYEAQQ